MTPVSHRSSTVVAPEISEALSRGWSQRYERPLRVVTPGQNGRRWRKLRLVGSSFPSLVYFPEDVGPKARKFLRESARYSASWPRAALKNVAAQSLITTGPGTRIVSSTAFEVLGDMPESTELLVAPGWRVVRVLDFERGRCLVIAHDDTDVSFMFAEIELRGAPRMGPFPQIMRNDPQGYWFEEKLVDGWPLPRCPAAARRSRDVLGEALDRLEIWQDGSRRAADPVRYAADLVARIEGNLREISAVRSEKFEAPAEGWLDAVAEVASSLQPLSLVSSHGDFRPANIMVARDSKHPVIIDWEHCRDRSEFFDRLFCALDVYRVEGIGSRLSGFTDCSYVHPYTASLCHNSVWRRAAACVFALEALDWYAYTRALSNRSKVRMLDVCIRELAGARLV